GTEPRALTAEAAAGRPTAEHREDVLEVRLAGATPAEGGAAPGAVAHPGATPSPAEGGEDVIEPPVAARAAGGEPGTAAGHRADGVVLTTLLRVGEHGVRLADVLELLLGRGVPLVAVGVVLLGELAVGLLDRRLVGVLVDAEDGVEVLVQPVLTGHVPSFRPSRLLRVGDGHAGGPQDALAGTIAGLEHGDDGRRRRVARQRLVARVPLGVHECLVDVRVEGLALGADALQAVLAQSLLEL